MKSNNSKVYLIVVFMFLVLVLSHLNAQVYHCQCDDYAHFIVATESGLTMRKLPSADSEMVTLLPFGTEVAGAIEHGNYQTEIIENIEGGWRKVFYKNESGYAFDGFLKRIEQPKLTLGNSLYFGFETEPKNMFGIFGNASDFGQQQFEIQKMTAKSDDENRYFELDCPEDDFPLFMVEGLDLKEQKIIGLAENQTKLLPGSIKTFHIGDTSYQLITDGNLVEVHDPENEFSPGYKIENYGLKLVKRVGQERTVQHLFQNEEINIWDGYYEGAMFIEFMGDLDGDEKLDLILTRFYDGGGETFFMLSSEAEEGFELKLMEKIYWGCC